VKFAFTQDQLAMTEAARSMLVESCTPATLRKLLERGAARDERRWETICDMGTLGILAPESAGGLGMGMPAFICIAEAAGYVALPEPMVELAGVVVPLLAELPDDRGLLKRVLSGEVVAVGHPANLFTVDADTAAALILAEGEEIHLVGADAVSLARVESLDPFRRLFRVSWTPSAATSAHAVGWGQTADRGAVLAAAQLLGLGQRLIDMAVDYAKVRTQFGKPTGSYQAVKHQLASAQVRVEFARPVVYAAAAELHFNTIASRARIAHAKIAAGEAAEWAARTCLQVHGAIGMTWESDVHFFLKRALALKNAWGSPQVHGKTVVERIFTVPVGPETTFASEVLQS
jgi:alkylation response protein AidB-like acyl-CoA dehydrogenase